VLYVVWLAAGDHTPDLAALLAADVIIATPEKWDGISRNWQTRGYVKKVRGGGKGCQDMQQTWEAPKAQHPGR
jgi:hypothetical protein